MEAIVVALLASGYCTLYCYFNLIKRLTGTNTSMIVKQTSAKVVYVQITLRFVWLLYGEGRRQKAEGSRQ
jgi:hypothetical protein